MQAEGSFVLTPGFQVILSEDFKASVTEVTEPKIFKHFRPYKILVCPKLNLSDNIIFSRREQLKQNTGILQ